MTTYIYDDGGRSGAYGDSTTGDCLVRAFAVFLRETTGVAEELAYMKAYAMVNIADAAYMEHWDDADDIYLRMSGFMPFGAKATINCAIHLGLRRLAPATNLTWEEARRTCGHKPVLLGSREHISCVIRGRFRDVYDPVKIHAEADRLITDAYAQPRHASILRATGAWL